MHMGASQDTSVAYQNHMSRAECAKSSDHAATAAQSRTRGLSSRKTFGRKYRALTTDDLGIDLPDS